MEGYGFHELGFGLREYIYETKANKHCITLGEGA
jgi:hypothetical protein